MAGIYGNSEAEALYPFLATDGDGNKPDCRARRGGSSPLISAWTQ
jgi:hypothetical protein